MSKFHSVTFFVLSKGRNHARKLYDIKNQAMMQFKSINLINRVKLAVLTTCNNMLTTHNNNGFMTLNLSYN